MDDLDDLDAIALAQFLEPRQPRVPMPLDEGETLLDDELPLLTDEGGGSPLWLQQHMANCGGITHDRD